MGTDEMCIYEFLKASPTDYVTEREIARRAAGKKRFRENEDWARGVLFRMVKDQILETDGCGQYRLRLRAKVNSTPAKLTMENWDTWQLVLDDSAEARDQTKQS